MGPALGPIGHPASQGTQLHPASQDTERRPALQDFTGFFVSQTGALTLHIMST